MPFDDPFSKTCTLPISCFRGNCSGGSRVTIPGCKERGGSGGVWAMAGGGDCGSRGGACNNQENGPLPTPNAPLAVPGPVPTGVQVLQVACYRLNTVVDQK